SAAPDSPAWAAKAGWKRCASSPSRATSASPSEPAPTPWSPMYRLHELLERNRHWSDRVQAEDPGFFSRLSKIQTPRYLWIGCSDSRVPANQVIDVNPGEVFVHRNISHVVVHTDLNCLSGIQLWFCMLMVEIR